MEFFKYISLASTGEINFLGIVTLGALSKLLAYLTTSPSELQIDKSIKSSSTA